MANHSTSCLYSYALSRLGLEDSDALRVIFWDSEGALKWDEATDWFIIPELDDKCNYCDSVNHK